MRKTTFITLVLVFLTLTASAQTPQVTPAPSDTASGEKSLDLIKGIKNGDLVLILKSLDAGASPNTVEDGTPALIWAVRANRVDIAEILVARGANVDEEESDDGTALQTAATAGQAQMVKLLIKHQADVNHPDHDGHRPLLFTVFGAVFKTAPAWLAVEDDEDLKKLVMGDEHELVAKLLLDAGAEVNAQANDCGLTPLMIAAMAGNVELTRILLDHHVDVNLSNGEWTALEFAEMFDSPEEVKTQMQSFDTAESKQAMLKWIQLTKNGRQVVAAMLKAAGAKPAIPTGSSAPLS